MRGSAVGAIEWRVIVGPASGRASAAAMAHQALRTPAGTVIIWSGTSPPRRPIRNGSPISPMCGRLNIGCISAWCSILYSGLVVGWSMSPRQDRQLVAQAVCEWSCLARPGLTPVILHSDRGCQFTSEEYQRFLKAHHINWSMSAAGSSGNNAAAESYLGSSNGSV